MPRPLSLAFVCVLLVGSTLAGTGFTPGQDAAATQSDPTRLQQADASFNSSTFTITVYENGSARWTFTRYTAELNESEREDFEVFAERFRSEETELWTNFQERAAVLTDEGSATTGRNMTARGFSRDARLDTLGARGLVEMSFIWTNFAEVSGDRIVVGDVFEGEFYVGSGQRLVFATGPELSFVPEEVRPEPHESSSPDIAESETVSWTGPELFGNNEPRIVFTSGQQPAGTDEGAGGDGQWPWVPMTVAFFVVVVLGLGAGMAWRSGMFGGPGSNGEGGAATTESAAGSTTEHTTEAEGTGGTVPEAAPDTTAGEAESVVPDEELLTDEDRVLQLLEDNGGRMKQANIVEETGWSKSKVSMLLSDMEDDEQISKLRVGRENIISLSGHEPDAAGSPFDDE